MPSPRAMTVVPALLLLAAGCSADEQPSPEPVPTTPAARPTPPLPEPAATGLEPVRTTSRAVWTSAALPAADRHASVVGDLVLLTGDRTQVVDLRSGRTLWRAPLPGNDLDLGRAVGSLGDLNDAPLLVDSTAGPRVLFSYYSSDCAFDCPAPADALPQRGVLALDARTGDVAWGSGLVGSARSGYLDPRDRDAQLAVEVVDASSQVVVAGVGEPSLVSRTRPDRTLPSYVVGLDPATGERLWVAPDVVAEPEAAAGDLVVGRVNDERAPYYVGLDARTGEQRWRSTEQGDLMWSVSPRVVVIDDFRLLDARTGRPLAEQPPPGTTACAEWQSGDLDVACFWADRNSDVLGSRLLTVGADGALSLSASIAAYPDTDWSPVNITDGVVGLDSFDDLPGAVDAAGRALVPDDPDLVVVSVDDRYVVLASGGDEYSGYGRLEVRRRLP